ncbi:MAG: exodeoxyribonuclease VII small subunit [Candidatus Saccharimonadales bacterium]
MSKPSSQPIEDKLANLREAVRWFESDEFTVDEALKRFEAAKTLAEDIEHELEEVKNTVTVLKEKFTQ